MLSMSLIAEQSLSLRKGKWKKTEISGNRILIGQDFKIRTKPVTLPICAIREISVQLNTAFSFQRTSKILAL